MDHDDDGETSYNTFVDDVAFEPTYPQALLTAAGRNVATEATVVNYTFALLTVCVYRYQFSRNYFLETSHGLSQPNRHENRI